MTENQLKQARRDQQEKQHALYGYCLTVFIWLAALIVLDVL